MYIDYIYCKTYALMWDNYKLKYMGLDGRKSVLGGLIKQGLGPTCTLLWSNIRMHCKLL